MYQVDIPSDQPYTYRLNRPQHGVLIYVLQGAIMSNGIDMQQEDTAFISDINTLAVSSQVTRSEIVLIETIR